MFVTSVVRTCGQQTLSFSSIIVDAFKVILSEYGDNYLVKRNSSIILVQRCVFDLPESKKIDAVDEDLHVIDTYHLNRKNKRHRYLLTKKHSL